MSKITAMYIRLSMEDEDVSLNQKEESNSVSSQRELLESFIGNHSELKDTKVQEYCDDGFTGTKFERPGYMKLMEDVRADKISCIVVKDLSRLGRDYIEAGCCRDVYTCGGCVRNGSLSDDLFSRDSFYYGV